MSHEENDVWILLDRASPGGHRYFYRKRPFADAIDAFNDGTQRLWVADDSGTNPENTDDGPWYVDVCDARPICKNGEGDGFSIPIASDEDTTSYVIADPIEALWVVKAVRDHARGSRRVRIHTSSKRADALSEIFRITEAAEKGLGYGV